MSCWGQPVALVFSGFLEGYFSRHLSWFNVFPNLCACVCVQNLCEKCSKTDPFCKGCFVYLGQGQFICPIAAFMTYLSARSPYPGPFFIQKEGCPLAHQQLPTFCKRLCQQQEYWRGNLCSSTGCSRTSHQDFGPQGKWCTWALHQEFSWHNHQRDQSPLVAGIIHA